MHVKRGPSILHGQNRPAYLLVVKKHNTKNCEMLLIEMIRLYLKQYIFFDKKYLVKTQCTLKDKNAFSEKI